MSCHWRLQCVDCNSSLSEISSTDAMWFNLIELKEIIKYTPLIGALEKCYSISIHDSNNVCIDGEWLRKHMDHNLTGINECGELLTDYEYKGSNKTKERNESYKNMADEIQAITQRANILPLQRAMLEGVLNRMRGG